jgi:hypothetical protein
MQYVPVPVISKIGIPLMPCHPARARELVRKGKAVRRFDRGIFYIKLTERETGDIQPIAIAVDPGSVKEGLTVMSQKHTLLNIETDTVDWVKEAEKASTNARRSRRQRKCPCRQPKPNWDHKEFLPPSTKARWDLKLRLIKKASQYYPIAINVVEDISAETKKGCRKWNRSFSPLEVGKKWFYKELGKLAPVITKEGWETSQERKRLGLHKTSYKKSKSFDAHCVDSWVLANMALGSPHNYPDNKKIMHIVPLRFHRRQLHVFQPSKGGIRKNYGGTMSMGLKRGSWVKHEKYGLCYVGGSSKGRITLHDMESGERVSRNIKPEECVVLTRASWRTF